MRYVNISVTLTIWLVLAGCASSDADDETPPPPPDDPAIPPPEDPPSAVFVLGDSLSDVGNLAAVADYLLSQTVDPPTVGLCNPLDVFVFFRPCDNLFYRQSRLSDGRLAVEHLAAYFGIAELAPSLHVISDRPGIGTVYAVGSAMASGPGPEDLSQQVDMVLLDHASMLPEDALYVVIIGGNDALDALEAAVADTPDAAQMGAAIITAAVDAIGANVVRLLDFGARRFIIANVPDLATLPAVRVDAQSSGDEAGMLAAASAVSQSFNTELGALLDGIEASGQWTLPTPLDLARFDLHAALQDVLADSVGNVLDACFDSAAYRDSLTAERIFHPDCAPVDGDQPRFADFVFWDNIHPTGVVHAAVGTALIELVSPN